ncbi:MAG: hypothetical protein ACOCP8_08475 [archaeon]
MENDFDNLLKIQHLLLNNGNIPVNKGLLYKFGANAAIMYSELLYEAIYYYGNNRTTKEGYFYSTISNIEKTIYLSRKEQDRAINKLIEGGLIEKKLKGIPPKRHFKILTNIDEIKNILFEPS